VLEFFTHFEVAIVSFYLQKFKLFFIFGVVDDGRLRWSLLLLVMLLVGLPKEREETMHY
jgi:hypothetical protein